MEILNIIRIVIEIIMFAGVFIASIYLVIYLKKFNSGINDITAKIENIGKEVQPVLNDISILAVKLQNVAEKVTRIGDKADNISGKILLKTEEAEHYIDEVRDSVVPKIRSAVNMLHALNSGFKTFYKKIK